MANTEFRVKPHETLPGNQMVEFWRDGVFVAGIYPHEDGIRIVSKYIPINAITASLMSSDFFRCVSAAILPSSHIDGVQHEQGYPPGVVVHLS